MQVEEGLATGEGDCRRGVEAEAAGIEGHDAVAEAGGEVHVVGDEEEGAAVCVETTEEGADLCGAGGVQAGGWFVQDQEFRAHGEDTCDGDPAFFAAAEGEGGAGAEGFRGEADVAQGSVDAGVEVGEAEVAGAEGDVVEDGVGKKLGLRELEDEADPAAEGAKVRGVGEVDVADREVSGGGQEEAVEVLGEGGLSGPAGADEGDDTVPDKVEVEVLKGGRFGGEARVVDVAQFSGGGDRGSGGCGPDRRGG